MAISGITFFSHSFPIQHPNHPLTTTTHYYMLCPCLSCKFSKSFALYIVQIPRQWALLQCSAAANEANGRNLIMTLAEDVCSSNHRKTGQSSLGKSLSPFGSESVFSLTPAKIYECFYVPPLSQRQQIGRWLLSLDLLPLYKLVFTIRWTFKADKEKRQLYLYLCGWLVH